MRDFVDKLADAYSILGSLPKPLLYLIAMVGASAIILAFIAILVMFFVWLERKVAGHIQDRLGPMEVGGWHGWAQSIADGIKFFLKEDIIPAMADKPLFAMAPIVVFVGAFAAYVVVPFSGNLQVADLNIGVFYILSITSLAVIGIIMAGWSSSNKWALYGAMRSAAQIISYEIPVGIALLAAILPVGSLSMRELVEAQSGGFWNWFIFRNPPFGFVACVIYFIAALAEVNRTPFDIPEAESELVAGYHTEYSGMRFAFFFLAEYANMFLVGAVVTTLFLGGWEAPVFSATFSSLGLGPVIFVLKGVFLVFVMMWLRWTLPRLRVDQLMYMSWKVLLPFAFTCLFGVSTWVLLQLSPIWELIAWVVICLAGIGVGMSLRHQAQDVKWVVGSGQ